MKNIILNLILLLGETIFISLAFGILALGTMWWKLIPLTFIVCFCAHYWIKSNSIKKQAIERDEKNKREFENAEKEAKAEIAKLEALAAQSLTINCPACNHEHVVQVRLDKDSEYICPNCSATEKLLINIRPIVKGATGMVGPLNMDREEIRSLFRSREN